MYTDMSTLAHVLITHSYTYINIKTKITYMHTKHIFLNTHVLVQTYKVTQRHVKIPRQTYKDNTN